MCLQWWGTSASPQDLVDFSAVRNRTRSRKSNYGCVKDTLQYLYLNRSVAIANTTVITMLHSAYEHEARLTSQHILRDLVRAICHCGSRDLSIGGTLDVKAEGEQSLTDRYIVECRHPF